MEGHGKLWKVCKFIRWNLIELLEYSIKFSLPCLQGFFPHKWSLLICWTYQHPHICVLLLSPYALPPYVLLTAAGTSDRGPLWDACPVLSSIWKGFYNLIHHSALYYTLKPVIIHHCNHVGTISPLYKLWNQPTIVHLVLWQVTVNGEFQVQVELKGVLVAINLDSDIIMNPSQKHVSQSWCQKMDQWEVGWLRQDSTKKSGSKKWVPS